MSRAEEILKERGKWVEPVKKEEPVVTDPVIPAEETDDELLAKLAKRGINAASLADLKPKEQPETVVDKVVKARQHAIENNYVTQEEITDYDDFSKQDKKDVAFRLFKEDFLENIAGTEEEGTYDDDDIQQLWDNRKMTSKEIDRIVNAHKHEKFGKVLKVEKKYDAYSAEIAQSHQYKGIVDEAFSKLPAKFQYKVDGVEIGYEPTKDALDYAKQIYLNSEAYKRLGKDATVESLISAIQSIVISKDNDKFLTEIAQAYFTEKSKDMKMGRVGAIDRNVIGDDTSLHGPSKTPGADAKLDRARRSA